MRAALPLAPGQAVAAHCPAGGGCLEAWLEDPDGNRVAAHVPSARYTSRSGRFTLRKSRSFVGDAQLREFWLLSATGARGTDGP